MSNIEFHPLIKPYAETFSKMVSGILGWRLLKIDEFDQLLNLRGSNDRVALAAEVLKSQNENITFSFKKFVRPLVTGELDHIQLLALTAQQLLGHCWEILRASEIVPNFDEPIFEFYRHIRNGCFHGNSFFFNSGQPKNRAEWRNRTITRVLQGKRIFRMNLKEREFYLNYGDVLVLLSDISSKIDTFNH